MLCETLPRWFVYSLILGKFSEGLAHAVTKLFIAQLLPGRPDDRELRRHQSLLPETIQGGNELPLGQIPSSAKNHNSAWGCDAFQTHTCAQWIIEDRRCHQLF